MGQNAVRDVIKECTKEHLEKGNLLLSQNVTAVGYINDTVPPVEKGIVELPTSDCSNGPVAVGVALAGKHPIYVIRFQGFGTYNLSSIVNYAAKSKEMWGISCPIFVRSISREPNIGPCASNSHHSAPMRFPGVTVISPMTPNEWRKGFNDFIFNSNVVYCSEHFRSFSVDYEIEDDFEHNNPDVTLLVIGPTRIDLHEKQDLWKNSKYKINIINISQLKPFILSITEKDMLKLKNSKFAVVVDDDYTICGASEFIAHRITNLFKVPTYTLGLEDRTAGFARHCDNIAPTTEEILEFIGGKL